MTRISYMVIVMLRNYNVTIIVIQQNNRGTANLRSHLLFHGMKDYAFKSQEDQRNPQKNNTPIISLSHQRKREIDEALLQCIIEAGLPY
ncbi:unnamed protein product, partial [Rotaria sp. Silwood2]